MVFSFSASVRWLVEGDQPNFARLYLVDNVGLSDGLCAKDNTFQVCARMPECQFFGSCLPRQRFACFISYLAAGPHTSGPRPCASHLRARGRRAWRDETGAAGRPDWYRKIESEPHAAEVLVAVIGRDSEGATLAETRTPSLPTALAKPSLRCIDAKATMPFVFAENQPVEAGPDRCHAYRVGRSTGARRRRIIGRPAADVPDGDSTDQRKLSGNGWTGK